MVAKKNKLLRNERGQSIMEFLAFVPFILGMLSLYLKLGSAINGSINQQKATRRFFYHLEKGNAFTPTSSLLFNSKYKQKQFAHFSSVGWNEELRSENPFAPCYIMPTFFNTYEDTCDEPKRDQATTGFVRLYTMHGICGGHYQKNANSWGLAWPNSSTGQCAISD